MKTTLDLPDDLMTAVKIRAARENRKLKDIIAEALRRDLERHATPTHGVCDIVPISAGRMIPVESQDRLEDMLDARGHRY